MAGHERTLDGRPVPNDLPRSAEIVVSARTLHWFKVAVWVTAVGVSLAIWGLLIWFGLSFWLL